MYEHCSLSSGGLLGVSKICKATTADSDWLVRKYKCPDFPTVQPTTYCGYIMCMADFLVKDPEFEFRKEYLPADLNIFEDSNTCKVTAATAAAAAAKSGSVLTASLTAVSVAIYATMF